MTMLKDKDWWKSKTIQAAAATFLIVILTAAFGETSPLVAIAIAVLSSIGIYGRKTAQHDLK